MENKKAKVGFVSLGCSKNLIDTEIMLSQLNESGYRITPDETKADVIVINTCGFINSAKQEAIDNILDIAWLKKNRNLKGIIVTGCLAERYKEEVMKEMPEVDCVLGLGSECLIDVAVEKVLNGERFCSFGDKDQLRLNGSRVLTTVPYTSYVKISEGCDNRCTYCAIPLIRGNQRSRKIEDIVEECKVLESLGVKELNIIAQDTSRYGKDLYGEYKIVELLQEISKNTTIPWIRLMYCYPDKITDELIAEIRDNDRVLKYIDIPIQHISPNVLKRMNRHCTREQIKDVIKKLRKEIPNICIRTTIMVGFPGETNEEFEELCEFVKESKFERLGAFAYSREEDTPAYDMEDQIDEQIKQDRYDILMKEQMYVLEDNNKKMLGKTLSVLCEGYDKVSETYYGRSEYDAPDIDTKIFCTSKYGGKKYKAGDCVQVKIKDILDYDIIGIVVGE